MYGGGQLELGPGRCQAQLLAALFHPDAPNDLAPPSYKVVDPTAASDCSDGEQERAVARRVGPPGSTRRRASASSRSTLSRRNFTLTSMRSRSPAANPVASATVAATTSVARMSRQAPAIHDRSA